MARDNNVSITDISSAKRWFKYWRIFPLFAILFCNASLLVTATAVGHRIDSSTKFVESVDEVTVGGVGGFSDESTAFAQLPHAFRHEERMERAVNELKPMTLEQKLSRNHNSTANTSGKSSGKIIYFQSQLQPHISEHLRHYNHRHSLASESVWEHNLTPLRHQRHQQKQNHQLHDTATVSAAIVTSSPTVTMKAPTVTEATTTNEHVKTPSAIVFLNKSSVTKQHRYFDRDGLYQSPYLWTTQGPKVRANRNEWTEGDFAELRAENREQTNSHRISLNLNTDEKDRYASENQFTEDSMDSSAEYDDISNDYSQEETTSTHEFHNHNGRIAVKRYTNPFLDLRLSPKKRDYQYPYSHSRQIPNEDRGGGDSKMYVAAESDSNSDTDFSSEKWQRIEQEHHRKQQEHQRQMLALRSRHDNHYRAADAAIHTVAPTIASAATMRGKQKQHNDDEDAENAQSQYYIPGTLTQQKQQELGTLAAVQESRRTHVTKHKHEKSLAGEHVKQILSEAACRIPQRRVERIQRDTSKMYMPHCTVLYRCTDESGCCRSERQTCAPKQTKNVDLYFYVRSINEKRGSVERLTFINHTECHCVERSRQQVDEYHNMPMYGISYNGQLIRRGTILNCNCPKLYEKILQEDGFCRCDCSSGNTGCDWLKRGMEHFSMIDRKCISESRCKPPTCEHGPYIKKYGRCPRREEQFSTTLTDSAMLGTNELSSSTDYH